MFFLNSLAFSMTQWMLAIWSLVPLPFLHPAGTSESLDSYKYVAFIFLRESIPRQVDKKSRVTKEEKGVWGFQGGHGVWNSLVFSMVQQMLAIWSLVSLPFLNPAWASGHSWFIHCWSLAWRILSITLLVCEWVQLCSSLNILWHCLSLGLETRIYRMDKQGSTA